MIIDASALLSAYFPDEAIPQAQELVRRHLLGGVRLRAPRLLLYEVTNVVWQGERRKRITGDQGDRILQSIVGLSLEFYDTAAMDALALARKYNCSAYDAAYLALAAQLEEKLITGDVRLYKAANPDFHWITWIQDYQ
jgi:predicted nucleic acid-binding protein